MRPEELQEEWEGLWEELHQAAEKMPEEATYRIVRAFASLSPSEREAISQLLANWVQSDDEAKRFDALAIIRQYKLASCLTALKDLAARLARSSEPGSPYELTKVKGIIDLLESVVRE